LNITNLKWFNFSTIFLALEPLKSQGVQIFSNEVLKSFRNFSAIFKLAAPELLKSKWFNFAAIFLALLTSQIF
jgi:hypothetical protein